MKVFIKYGYLLDPNTTWTHLSSFEQELADFFGEKGYETEYVRTQEGQEAMKILYIYPITEADFTTPEPEEKLKTPKQQVAAVIKKIPK